MDNEFSDTNFMGLLQRSGVLKAIVSSRYLCNFQDLFNFVTWSVGGVPPPIPFSFPTVKSP